MNKKTAIVTNSCIICGGRTSVLEDLQLDLVYDVCDTCEFIYKQASYHIPLDQEKERYLQHHNSDENIGYVTYLTGFIEESITPLKGVSTILDFGSGPEPMLANLLEERDYHVTNYDPFFHNDVSYADKTYDLIVLTEVLEHIHRPLPVLIHLFELLNPGGRVLIMTQFHPRDKNQFLTWWYRRDTTHVGFYSKQTFEAIADICNVHIEDTNGIDRVVLKR
jgi:SAM-dependent methyltransferase